MLMREAVLQKLHEEYNTMNHDIVVVITNSKDSGWTRTDFLFADGEKCLRGHAPYPSRAQYLVLGSREHKCRSGYSGQAVGTNGASVRPAPGLYDNPVRSA